MNFIYSWFKILLRLSSAGDMLTVRLRVRLDLDLGKLLELDLATIGLDLILIRSSESSSITITYAIINNNFLIKCLLKSYLNNIAYSIIFC